MKRLVYYLYIIIFLSYNCDVKAKNTTPTNTASTTISLDNIFQRSGNNSLYSNSTAFSQHEQLQHLLWLNIIILILLLLSLIFIAYNIKRKRGKYKSYIEENNIKYAKLLKSFQTSLEVEESLKSSIDKIKKDKDAEIEELKEMLSTYTNDVNENEWDKEHFLLEHETVCHMHSLATKICLPSNKEWTDLKDIVKKILPNFMDFIMCTKPKLTEKELQVCILTRLSFTPSEIGILINASKQRVSNHRSILNKRLFNETGSKTFSQNLYNI